MLTIRGAKQRFCYGISRRRFFKIGGFAVKGLRCQMFCAPKMLPGNVRPTRR